MARAKVIHSDDAVQINLFGNPRNPEPSTAVIKFPGGHVEVTRTSDGTYWARLNVEEDANIVRSRVDFTYAGSLELEKIPDLPMANEVSAIGLRIASSALG